MITKIKETGRKYLTCGLIAGAIFACSKDSSITPEPEPIIPEAEHILSDKTKVFSSSDLEEITQLTDSTIVFSDAVEYSKGDILAGGMSPNSPNGFLRKVENIENNQIYTSNASLENAITKGDFSFEKRLTMNDIKRTSSSKLNSGISSGYDFHYPINDLVVYDLDKDTSTTNDQVVLNGDIYFNATAKVDAKFNRGLKRFNFETEIKGETNLEVEAGLNIPNIDKQIKVYEQTCLPISIVGPFGLPIIFRPNFQIYAGVQGSFDAKAVAQVDADISFENKLVYENNNWDLNTDFTKKFDFKIPEAYLNTDVKAYGGTRLDLILYESLGPYAQAEEYLKLNVDTKDNPWWKLSGGVIAKIGVDMGRLSNIIPNYEKVVYEDEKIIGQAEESMKPEAIFRTTPIIGEAPLKVDFDLSESTSGEKIKDYSFTFGNNEGEYIENKENSPDGAFDGKTSHIYNTPGTYLVKGLINDEAGRSSQDSLEVRVQKGIEKPNIHFNASSTSGEAPLEIIFDASESTSGRPIETYFFDFGKGQETYLEQENNSPDGDFDGKVKHVYKNPGTYWAIAKVIDSDNRVSTDSLEIKVSKKEFHPIFGRMIDKRDGQEYKTVTINGQTWMAENMNYASPSENGKPTWRFYEDNPEIGKIYGRMYEYLGAMLACPDGWHIPNEEEYLKLINHLGGPDVAGGRMKEVGYEHWNEPNKDATNESGFGSLGSGSPNGVPSFIGLKKCARYWTSTRTSYSYYRTIKLYDYTGKVGVSGSSSKYSTISVRYIKDK